MVREDVEQLFILQALQRYKSESLATLRWTLATFLLFAVLQVVLFGALPLLLTTA
jgi:hypothetical protein